MKRLLFGLLSISLMTMPQAQATLSSITQSFKISIKTYKDFLKYQTDLAGSERFKGNETGDGESGWDREDDVPMEDSAFNLMLLQKYFELATKKNLGKDEEFQKNLLERYLKRRIDPNKILNPFPKKGPLPGNETGDGHWDKSQWEKLFRDLSFPGYVPGGESMPAKMDLRHLINNTDEDGKDRS